MPDFQLVPVDHDPFEQRLDAAGEPAAPVEDRRSEPKSGYDAMQKNLNFAGAAVRHEYPFLREFDMTLPTPKYQKRQGPLSAQAGYYDIPDTKVPWTERLGKDLDYTFFGMAGLASPFSGKRK